MEALRRHALRDDLRYVFRRKIRRCLKVLLELGVFGLGLLQDWDVGIGVFPQRRKIQVSSARLHRLAWQGACAPYLQMSKRADGLIQHDSPVVEDLLKLSRCFAALVRSKMRSSSNVDGVQIRPVIETQGRESEFVGNCDVEGMNCVSGACVKNRELATQSGK